MVFCKFISLYIYNRLKAEVKIRVEVQELVSIGIEVYLLLIKTL